MKISKHLGGKFFTMGKTSMRDSYNKEVK